MTSIKVERELSLNDLSISLSEVLLAMGCDTSFRDSTLENETVALLDQLSTLLRPRFQFFTTNGRLNLEKKLLHIDETTLSVGQIISRQIRQSEQFLFFVATAGSEFEEWQHTSAVKDDMLKSYIADSLGSIIAEKTADMMELLLEDFLQTEGLKHTNRYSPGYCGWHVSEQHLLFSLFDEPNPCGITLTESSLMLPIKSVSGVIGIGKDVRKLDYTCGMCNYEKCFRRKKV